jgi:prephenate dehydratase
MASIRKVDYYSMKVKNRAGSAAGLLNALKAAGVNLLAFTGFPSGGGAQVDFIPQNRARFVKAARRAKVKLSPRKTVFLVQGSDRVGALTGIVSKLAAARISLTALDAVTAGQGRFGAIFWVKKHNVARASRLLKAR